jgi:A/G-specific adenine glycosylase
MARVAGPRSKRRKDSGQKRSLPSRGNESTLREGQIHTIRRQLLRWGRTNYTHYPWRSETDPWLSFLAELLLQRTRAAQVEPVFINIQERFPTAASLAVGGLAAVNGLTSKLGLHRRGPLLLRVAEAVAARGGVPPHAMPELQRLPGVGMYTAAAWLSLHRNRRAAIIDANVARWLSRMTGLPYNRDPRHVRWVNKLADELTPRRGFREFNYAVLDFTMTVCVPRNPRCGVCPVLSTCRYGQGEFGAD